MIESDNLLLCDSFLELVDNISVVFSVGEDTSDLLHCDPALILNVVLVILFLLLCFYCSIFFLSLIIYFFLAIFLHFHFVCILLMVVFDLHFALTTLIVQIINGH